MVIWISSTIFVVTRLAISVISVLERKFSLFIKIPFNFLTAGLILMGASMIKYSVSKIPDVRPNNKYVYVHGFNFLIWIILLSLFAYGLKRRDVYHKSGTELYFFFTVLILQDLVVTCIDCFLMWQVLRYARGKKRSNQDDSNIT